jgi:hypothetical protein
VDKLSWIETNGVFTSSCGGYRVFKAYREMHMYNIRGSHYFFHSLHKTLEQAQKAAEKESEELYTW